MTDAFTVTSSESGQRLDIFCVGKLSQFSRAAIQKAIKAGDITVNKETTKPRRTLKAGDKVAGEVRAPVADRTPAELPPLPVLYEDKDAKVINKPAGIDSNDIDGHAHRLDKDTSGVMVLAKTPEALEHLREQFKKRRVKKEYLALVFGVPSADDGRINQPLARSPRNPLRRTITPEGKPAITEWQREQRVAGKYALLRVFPLTGRTHQIRVHMHFIGHPIVGDKLYTFKRQKPPPGVTRQLLHAEKLTLTLPSGKKKTFLAPLEQVEDFPRE